MRPRNPRAPILGLAALVLLTTASPALAYIVFLKNGSQIVTQKKYEIKGSQAILTMPNGTQVSYKASEIDLAKTEEVNRAGSLSGARIIDTKSPEPLKKETPVEEKETFGSLISQRTLALPEPAKRTTGAEGALPKTSAGFVNLPALPRKQFADPETASQIMSYLKGQGLDSVRVYQGTGARRAMVEIQVSSEASAFKAMKDVANCVIQIGQAKRIEAFELLMIADDKTPAGQFTLNADLATQLASGRIESSTFFVRYVEF
jgi:hypothetical protein